MAKAPARIVELVETFDRNIEEYRSQKYNEAQLRREFIDPFFEELGWDLTNKQGFAPQYREVIHEYAIKISGETKAPDYCFRIGGARKFFLEAKKPSVNIDTDPDPAYQLRRYAWSAKLPLSIITNFETFAVYDCQIRPKHTDRPTTARIMNLTYKEYLDKWNEIAGIFSKYAVLKGSFDKFAVSAKGKRGTTTVDTEFLAEIEKWRKTLAQIIALRNSNLYVKDINFAVQQTIDRILFLRLCEDRGIEPYGQLRAISSGDRNYPRLCEIFEKADQRYNSGLFHFSDEPGRAEPPDELTLNLVIDDKDLKWILHNLYYPQSPYEFSVLPADILGNVYEQFLGKVIRLTSAHRAIVEEKPEVKKAGGVYYTPAYIVDYIVKNTIGRLIGDSTVCHCESAEGGRGNLKSSNRKSTIVNRKSLTPKQVANLRILDPACGSGSFLLGAYTYLLDYHLNWYIKNDPENWARKKNPPIYEVSFSPHPCGGGPFSNYRLTVTEKKRILLNNIFGVDIDSQAVEVTKLSLLLKVLEGENSQTLENQYRLFHERALPDLGSNIKCGNSLIGPDFFDSFDSSCHSRAGGNPEELRDRINVFDWQAEFPEIFNRQNPGFDAVIGNPPYISVESTIKDVTEYYLKVFKSAYGRANSFSLFLERSLELLSRNGYSGLITSNRILTNTQLAPLRKLLLEQSTIEGILTFKKTVFKAAVDTTVIVFRKELPSKKHVIKILFDITDLDKSDFEVNKICQTTLFNTPSYVFNVRQQEKFKDIIQKIKKDSSDLETICDVKDGIILGAIKDLLLSETRVEDRYEKWLEGNEVSRYHIQWKKRYICYDPTLLDKELKRKRDLAKQKAKTFLDFKKLSQSGVRLRTPQIFRQHKILTRQNAKRPIAVFDDNQYFVKNSLHCIILKDRNYDLKYILGLINSDLVNFYFQDQIGSTGEIFSQMKIAYVKKLPIHKIDFNNPDEKSIHDKMVTLVEQMLDLHKRLSAAKVPDEKTQIQRQIDTTDKQIDKLVYDLYDLTEEEIKIVEENM